MSKNTEIQGYEIIVIQSLKKDDLKTGEILYNDILRYKPVVNQDVYVKYYSISTRDEFKELLERIKEDIPSNHTLTLHFETHGCIDGIGLESNELITWEELFSLLRPINIKLSNLLMVIMSMCQGAAISSHLEPNLRCPFRAFVGFEKDMKANDLLEAYSVFYESYNNMLDVSDALIRTNRILPKDSQAWLLTAIRIFDNVLNPDTNPESFDKAIESNYNGYNNNGKPTSKEEFKEEVRQYFLNIAKENREYYNFKDLDK